MGGKANPVTGQIVGATITLIAPEDPGLLKRRVREFCLKHLERYKIPAVIDIVQQDHHGARFKKARKEIVRVDRSGRAPPQAAFRSQAASRRDPPGPYQPVAIVSGGSRGLGAELVAGSARTRLSRCDLEPVEDRVRHRDRYAGTSGRVAFTGHRSMEKTTRACATS